MKYSIIIPTYNHCDDLLKPCIESLERYTDFSTAEIVIVANGCTDNTREYIDSLTLPIKVVWEDQALGYTRAANLGIKAATGDYVILLNNDTEILPSPRNYWLEQLARPFINNNKMALTGSLKLYDHDIQQDFIVFCCAMIKREIFDKLGLLDEIFNPGYGEDIDFTMRVLDNGYQYECIDETTLIDGMNVGQYPLWHKGNKTFSEIPEYSNVIVHRNRYILIDRYITNRKKFNKKYSIVIPTYNHCNDLLKPCIESIQKYTDMADVEVIVVANGCIDNTNEYVESLGAEFKLVWIDDAVGYTRATNEGIKAARGEYVVLMNNDVVLLDQPVNQWLDLLVDPFVDSTVGVTGPVKFSWQCGGFQREAMAFWLVMIKREVFDKIGILDEIFSPGMGEDGDFCIRAVESGYKLISVPHDVTGDFGSGVKNLSFPIFHKGNGTFADDESLKESVIYRNNLILSDRFGIGDYFTPSGYKTNTVKYFDDTPYEDAHQREVYQKAKQLSLQNGYTRILDIGCGSAYKLKTFFEGFNIVGVDLPTTVNWLKDKYPNDKWLSVDLEKEELHAELTQEFDLVICSDVIEHMVDPDHLIRLLQKLSYKKLVVSTPDRFLIEQRGAARLGPPQNVHHVREWNQREFARYLENSGFTIEEHYISNVEQVTQVAVCSLRPIEISIVMPTYNHFEDAFKPGIDALLAVTDLSNKEIIVVANGCNPDDMTRTYLEKIGGRIRYVWIKDPAGYIGAVNAGIDASLGKYIVLIDNDSHLLPQQTDQWIHILQKPFLASSDVGATSPFAHEYEDMGFVLHSGCTMYNAKLLRDIGKFDTTYMPGYFSDSDVSMKIWNAGYRCVEVPNDRANKNYTDGVFAINFPVVHTGTVQTMDKNKDIEIVRKNREILYLRYGKKMISPRLELMYNYYMNTPIDIHEHMPTLRRYASECKHITEFGTRFVVSTYAFMAGKPEKLLTYDIVPDRAIWDAAAIAKENNIEFGFMERDTTAVEIEPTELLFIDTLHSYKQLKTELALHSDKVSKYIIFHDTETFGRIDEATGEAGGLMTALEEFLATNKSWKLKEHYTNCNGLSVIERVKNVKYTVVIPTYNHCDDLLKPCIESIQRYSDMSEVEIIVVANGCVDHTKEYVESLGAVAKLIWVPEAIGYTKATNLGIKAATGDYIILLNNDTELLPQENNTWLDMLTAPFIRDSSTGITGPLQLFDNYANSWVMIFFCVMIKREVFDKIGLLDEIF